MDPYDIVRKIKAAEAKITKSKEHLNEIIAILNYCQSLDNLVVFSATKALGRIFSRFIEGGELRQVIPGESLDTQKKEADVNLNAQVNQWIVEQYLSFIEILKKLLFSGDSAVQISTLHILLQFEQKIGTSMSEGKTFFTNVIFFSIIKNLVTNPNLNTQLLTAFNEQYLQCYDDIRFFTIENLSKVINEFLSTSKVNRTIFIENVYLVLRSVSMPSSENEISKFFVQIPNDEPKKKVEKNENSSKKRKIEVLFADEHNPAEIRIREIGVHRRSFQKCWLQFLKMKLPVQIYKIVLGTIHEKIIPHFHEPVILMDWLTESCNYGGEIGMLALNGLFVLITKFNLDYPEFYPKLYKLLEPSIFSEEYGKQFFSHLQIFLSSPLLPAYLVTAFIKKLIRLCLIAPPHVTIIVLPLVYNLMISHPTTQVLIHKIPKFDNTLLRLNSEEIAQEDPFDPNQTDLKKCNAIQSSLWELKALMNHNIPAVASMAKMFKNKITSKVEYNMQDFIKSYDALFEEEVNRRVKKGIPLAFQEPPSFFSTEEFPEGW